MSLEPRLAVPVLGLSTENERKENENASRNPLPPSDAVRKQKKLF